MKISVDHEIISDDGGTELPLEPECILEPMKEEYFCRPCKLKYILDSDWIITRSDSGRS